MGFQRFALAARTAAACCVLAIAWPGPAAAFAVGRFVPGAEAATLAVLGIGLTVAGLMIGRRKRRD